MLEGGSSTIYFEAGIDDLCAADNISLQFRQVLSDVPFIRDCHINLIASPHTNTSDIESIIAACEGVSFGDTKSAPKAYLLVPPAVGMTEEFAACLARHNTINAFLNVVLTVRDPEQADVFVKLFEPQSDGLKTVMAQQVPIELLFYAGSAKSFQKLAGRFSKISLMLYGSAISTLLQIGFSDRIEDVAAYKFILEKMPFFGDKLAQVPRLPVGYLDALYCKLKAVEFGIDERVMDVSGLCSAMRNFYFTHRSELGKFEAPPVFPKGYQDFTGFVSKRCITEVADVRELTLARKAMGDFVND